MIVDEVAVFRGEEKVASALIDLMPPGLSWTTFVRDISGRAFTSGKEIDLISLEGDENDSEFVETRRRVREALSSLSARVYYQSVYGDRRYVQRSLDWFGRHLKTGEST